MLTTSTTPILFFLGPWREDDLRPTYLQSTRKENQVELRPTINKYQQCDDISRQVYDAIVQFMQFTSAPNRVK